MSSFAQRRVSFGRCAFGFGGTCDTCVRHVSVSAWSVCMCVDGRACVSEPNVELMDFAWTLWSRRSRCKYLPPILLADEWASRIRGRKTKTQKRLLREKRMKAILGHMKYAKQRIRFTMLRTAHEWNGAYMEISQDRLRFRQNCRTSAEHIWPRADSEKNKGSNVRIGAIALAGDRYSLPMSRRGFCACVQAAAIARRCNRVWPK